MGLQHNPHLITPPKEEEEVYPYRRVWLSIMIQSGILMVLMVLAFILVTFFGLRLPEFLRFPVNLTVAVIPAILWLIFSRLPESFVPQPRQRLMTVFVMSALVANAVGLPLLDDFFQPEQWLSLESAFTRIIGYTVTVGVLQEVLKFSVLRFVVWPDYYRVRTDAIAYGVASAVGYALMVNLNYIAQNMDASLDAVTLRIFANTALHIVGSVVMAYGLAETVFSGSLAFLLPFTLLIASLLAGIAIPMRAGFVNAPLGLTISTPRVIFGIAFAGVLYVGPMASMLFLFRVAQRREQDKQAGQDA